MECHDARLLLTLQRRDPEQLDSAELEAVERHIELCPGCQTWNQSEARFETAVASAMRKLETPAGLKGRISARLASSRPYNHRVWAAVAAALFLAVGASGMYYWMRPEAIDPYQVVIQDDEQSTGPGAVQNYFASLGYPMVPPPDFLYEHLVECKLVRFQGRVVPRLTFRARQANGSDVTAKVYCLPSRHFFYDDTEPIHFASGRQIQVVQGARELYVIDSPASDIWLLRRGTY